MTNAAETEYHKMILKICLSISGSGLDVPPGLKKPQANNCSCLFPKDISPKTLKNNFSSRAYCALYGRIISVWVMMRTIRTIAV